MASAQQDISSENIEENNPENRLFPVVVDNGATYYANANGYYRDVFKS